MIKIDYITGQDPADIRTWSGLNFFIARTLEAEGAMLHPIFDLSAKPDFGLKWRWHLWNFLGKNYQYERSFCYARQMGAQASARLSKDSTAVFSSLSAVIPFLETDKPVYLYNDASFENLTGYYDHFSNLSASSKRMGDELERLAYEKCRHLFFASDWAAHSALHRYGIPAGKVTVAPFGANLVEIPDAECVREHIQSKKLDTLNILFNGVEFNRKGGALAVEIVRRLNEGGQPARLVMVGMKDLAGRGLPDFVTDEGFLSKSDPAQTAKLVQLYFEAHFFLLPSQKECFGVVFSEAAAFGLPCLGIDTGGVGSAVTTGENGWLFSAMQGAEAWVERILSIAGNPSAYKSHSNKAREMYDHRLNWKTTGNTMMSVIRKEKAAL